MFLIGDFKFEIDNTRYEELTQKISFGFATHETVGSFNEYQSIGKWEESHTIVGTLICKKQTQFKDFEDMAKKKESQTLSLANGEVSTVLITEFEKIKNSFLKSGEFLKQSYTIQLQRVGEE